MLSRKVSILLFFSLIVFVVVASYFMSPAQSAESVARQVSTETADDQQSRTTSPSSLNSKKKNSTTPPSKVKGKQKAVSKVECSSRVEISFDTIMTFRRRNGRNGFASVDWVGMDLPQCQHIQGFARHGGFRSSRFEMMKKLGSVACRMVSVLLAANEDGEFRRTALHAPVNITLPLSPHHIHWFSPNGANVSSNLTVQHFNVIPTTNRSRPPPTHWYFVGEFVPSLAGHALDHGGPQMQWILRLHQTREEKQRVVLLYHDVPPGDKSFGEGFLSMIRLAYPEFIWLPIPFDNRVLLLNRNVTVVSALKYACASFLAREMWPRLKEVLLPRRLPVHRAVAILKMNSNVPHFTNRFLNVSEQDRKWLESEMDVAFLPEDIPKEERMWHINMAQVVFSSSGANGDINRHFYCPHNSSTVTFIEFVHPLAEDFKKTKCKPDYKWPPTPAIFYGECLTTTSLTRDHFLKYLVNATRAPQHTGSK